MRKLLIHTLSLALLALLAGGAVACRNRSGQPKVVKLDWATYNPVSLVLRDKKFLEEDLGRDGIGVEWVQSLGSNKALELLNSKSIDFGSTAGVAALIGRANGNPIKAIYVYSKPEWTALAVSKDSSIQRIQDLKGRKVAVTRGTDPHVFLLRALDSVGLTEKDIDLVPLQHSDGRNALERGDVAAWAGLDPLLAQTEVEKGSRLFYRDADKNTYGILNVREAFAAQYPGQVKRVLAAYEKARLWALQNPEAFRALLMREARLSEPVATRVLERTDLSHPAIGQAQRQTILAAGGVLRKSGIIRADVDVDKVVAELIDEQYGLAVLKQPR